VHVNGARARRQTGVSSKADSQTFMLGDDTRAAQEQLSSRTTTVKSNPLVAPLLWAALYFIFGYFSYSLNGSYVATGYIWLPAGITVSALLLSPPARWFAVLVLLLAAQILLGWLEQRELWRIALLALNEIGVAALVVWRVRRTPLPMAGLHFVRGLLMIAVGTSLISAVIGAVWFALQQDAPFWPTLRVWFLSDLVGILIITPVLAAWSRFSVTRCGGIARSEFLLGLLAFFGVLLSAYVAFDSEFDRWLLDISFSSTYVPLFFIALVTLLWGGRGGALSVAALALIAFVYNARGQGPFAELVQLHSTNALLEMQVYLAVASLLSLLISALKTTREQLHEQVARWKSEVEVALSVSRQLVYSIDPQALTVSWSGDVEAVLGVPRQQLASLAQVLVLVHPLDQHRLRQRWLEPDAQNDHEEPYQGSRPDMPFRLQLNAGRLLTVTDMSYSLRDASGNLTLIAGAWRFDATTSNSEWAR